MDRDAVTAEDIVELNCLREVFRGYGLIGETIAVVSPEKGPEPVGYGNVSMRKGTSPQFIITGSRTGSIELLGVDHYALVTHVDIAGNLLEASGRIDSSAESMTHAAIYRAKPEVRFVGHAHHEELWRKLLGNVPTTPKEALYGSPEIAKSILNLCSKIAGNVGVVVMGGHDDGILFYGCSWEDVMSVVQDTAEHFLGRRFSQGPCAG